MQASQDVQAFINTQPFSRLQRSTLMLCFLVILVDGFDTAAIGFIAPSIRAEWQLSGAALAPLFGAGLFGLMLGALFFGPLADKLGRKIILICSVAFFGLASLVSMFSPNLEVLILLRFLTGLGLGGAMPMTITLSSEYCPDQRRSGLVTMMFCGFTIGSALGGLVSAHMIAAFGWRSVLLLGGVLPLAMVPILMRYLPESLRFLVLRKPHSPQIARLSQAIAPGLTPYPQLTADESRSQTPIRELFKPRYALGTAMLWLGTFMSMLIIYLISSWLPTLLNSIGISISRASLITATFQIGGTIGALLLGQWMDRLGAGRTLSTAYIAGAGFVILCAFNTGQLWLLVLAVFGVGFCISGSQVGANALSAAFYPTNNRATGVSWNNAAGRVGSIVGSLSGGWMMSMQLDISMILSLLVIPALIAAVALACLGRIKAGMEQQVSIAMQNA